MAEEAMQRPHRIGRPVGMRLVGEAGDGGVRVARVELQMLRLRLLLSGEELAQKAGIALSTYQRVERGEQDPHPKTMRGLALALGVDEAEMHRLICSEEARGPLRYRSGSATGLLRSRSLAAPVEGLVVARTQRGWSLQVAGGLIGVSVHGLRCWETGTYQPRPRRIPYIARAYETSEAEVRGWWTSWDR